MARRTLDTVTFTADKIGKLEAREDGKERIVRCGGFTELVIAISPQGKKSFAIYKSYNGKPWRKKVGDFYAGVDLEQVRKNAVEVLNQLNAGNDPKKKRIEDTLTFLEVFNRWKLDAIARKKRTIAHVEHAMNKHLVSLHNKKLAEITADDVTAITNKLATQKRPKLVQANRQIELVSRMFNFARKRYGYRGDNPAAYIEKFPEQPSQKFMSEEQFRKFIETAKLETNAESRAILLLLAFSAVRVSCGVRACFSEFDMEAKLWRIPALKSKNGREMVLPLNNAAIQVIKERRTLVKGDYLFPSRATKKRDRHEWVNRAFNKVCEKCGIKNVVVHSIRKSFGAFAINTLKLPLYEVSKLLCHSSTRITEKSYSKLENKTLAASSDLIANALG